MNKKVLSIILGVILVVTSVVSFVGCAHRHDFEVFYQHADCDSQGYTLHTCTECGYQYADEFTAPLGHSWRTYYHLEDGDDEAEIATCSLTRDAGSDSHYSLFTSVDEDALRKLLAMQYDLTFCKHTVCEFCQDPYYIFYKSGIIQIPPELIKRDALIEEMKSIQKHDSGERITINIPSVETKAGVDNVPKITIRTGEYDSIISEITGRWTLNIPDSIIRIEYEAFRDCSRLDRVKLSNNVRYIEARAFADAKILYVIIPKSVQYIGDYAFGPCLGSMVAVYYCGTQEEWNKIEFQNPHDPLKSIAVYYYNETSTTEGIYWRYNGDGEPYHDLKIAYVNR